jgi:hypothetical protein
MENLPFNTDGLGEKEIKQFATIHQALKEKFNIQHTGHIDFHLEQFEIFKYYLDFNLRDSYVIKHTNNDCYVFFVDTHHKTKDSKGHITDHYTYQTWALAYLKQDMGRILIRPETLTDKILEIIHPLELDFEEDKAFSDAFYVVVNDHAKAIAGIDRNFRNAVMDIRHDDLVIEIVEHTLIIGNRRPISTDKALQMAAFVSRLCSMC